jgi:hypothetical protein
MHYLQIKSVDAHKFMIEWNTENSFVHLFFLFKILKVYVTTFDHNVYYCIGY